jgi:hypothetical protein
MNEKTINRPKLTFFTAVALIGIAAILIGF